MELGACWMWCMVVGFSGWECAHAVFYQLDQELGGKGVLVSCIL
jgi:hypothetical protein